MTNELAKKETFDIVPMSDEMKTIMVEELAGLGPIPFDSVTIPSGGGLAFEVPGDDPEKPSMESTLSGVVVYHHPINAYWREEYSGGSVQPDCASYDAKMGLEIETGELRRCDQCEANQFGSAKDGGKGKACKNGHRIYLLRDGEVLPILLALPPTSLKPFKEYIAKRLLMKGMRPLQVVTEVSLVKDTSANGIKYSKCSFKKVGELTEAQIAQAEQAAAFIRSVAGNVTIEDAPMDAPFEDVKDTTPF